MTVNAVIEAAERVLEREGLSALTTRRVAEVAGVSAGTLYQYFPGKEAIVARLAEIYLERQLALFAEAFARTPPSATIEEEIAGFVRAVLASHAGERKILGDLYTQMPLTAYQQTLAPYRPYLVEVLRRHPTEVRIGRLEVAASLLLYAGDGLIRAFHLGAQGAQPEHLVEEFVRMVAAYLRS